MAFTELDRALRYAAEKHSGQFRDGDHPLPYLFHPMEVVWNLRYTGEVTDETLLVAAALHDVIEQTGLDPAEIQQRFGEPVKRLVVELTRREPTRDEAKGLSKEEIKQIRSKWLLDEISKMSPDAMRIKLADRLSNVREARRTKLAAKLERYKGQTEEVLKIVPRTVSPGLWDAIRKELEEI